MSFFPDDESRGAILIRREPQCYPASMRIATDPTHLWWRF